MWGFKRHPFLKNLDLLDFSFSPQLYRGSRLGSVTPASAMTSTSGSSKAEFHVGGKYRLVRKIGSGSFGDIYLGKFRSWRMILNLVNYFACF